MSGEKRQARRMKPDGGWYRFLYSVVRIAMFFWHPVFRVSGREHIPQGACVICSNHIGMADPLWTIFALREKRFFRIMAKEQLLEVPLLGRLLRWLGLIGVKRGENDVHAVREALKALKSGEKLLIYPEGTRARSGPLPGKTGAVLLAQRAGCPILPVYIQRRRRPFSPLRLVIGPARTVTFADRRATAEELREATDALMDEIYAMGADVG